MSAESPFEWREARGVPVEVSNAPASVPIRRLRFDPAVVRALIERVEKMPANGDGHRLFDYAEGRALRSALAALAAVLSQPRADVERLGLWHAYLGEPANLSTRRGWRQLRPADHATLLALLRGIIDTYTVPPTR